MSSREIRSDFPAIRKIISSTKILKATSNRSRAQKHKTGGHLPCGCILVFNDFVNVRQINSKLQERQSTTYSTRLTRPHG